MDEVDGVTMQLVRSAQAGDGAAREQLFARYLPRVARMVAARLGVARSALPAAADDMAQDALLRALQSLDRFEMRSPGAFMAWMATIVLNCVRRHHRQEHGDAAGMLWQRYGDLDLGETLFAGREGSPSSVAARREDQDRLEAALLTLPALYREALSLRALAGMSHAEIAQALGRTEANSRKIVQRATEMLQAAYARGAG